MSSGRRTKHGCSAAQLAIAWLLDQEGVIVIPHSYLRLTASLGRMHPKPNAGEHSFDAPDQFHEQLRIRALPQSRYRPSFKTSNFPLSSTM